MKRTSKNTSITERSDVNYNLWRKKVDNTLFKDQMTPIPVWVADMWGIKKKFKHKNGLLRKKDKNSLTKIFFNDIDFPGNITCSKQPKGKTTHRLHFSYELKTQLAKTFTMSYMRYWEAKLRGNVGDIEKKIPFWEFLDIEFNEKKNEFIFKAHYTQESSFPELFKQLPFSHLFQSLEDKILDKSINRIYKKDWKKRADLNKEIASRNVIYHLIDISEKKIYIGETEQNLKDRLNTDYQLIPNWTHFRYDVLPADTTKDMRVAIEKMVIRSFASLLPNTKKIPNIEISNYKLVNKKIDR